MIRDRWNRLDREARLVVGIATGFILLRVAVASQSGFGFHQGWNEGHYSLLARGFLDHALTPRYADRHVYNVPPLFPYLVSGSFVIFGQSEVAARLPSILATGGLIVATYELGRSVFDDRLTALVGAGLLAVLPYVQLYGGRVQTDALMVFLVTASIAAIVRGYDHETNYVRWLVVGGALFAAAVATKQPAMLVAGITLAWLLADRRFDESTVRRTGVLIGASALFLLPLFAWLLLNYLQAPSAFVHDWTHETFGRTEPFSNVPLLLAVALGLGMTPPVLLGAAVGLGADLRGAIRRYSNGLTDRPGPSILTWWVLLYGLFVFARTPHGHQYYALVLAPPIALFAANGLTRASSYLGGLRQYRRETIHLTLVGLLLVSSVFGTAVLFELSGEYSIANGAGSHVGEDAGTYVDEELPDNATVLVSNGYEPPIRWYVDDGDSNPDIVAYHVPRLDQGRIRAVANESKGPVYLVYPRPSWGALPVSNDTESFRTPPYEYTIMGVVGSAVSTDSKFTFYLNHRRLLIYRVDSPP